jgi:hypothetical protein
MSDQSQINLAFSPAHEIAESPFELSDELACPSCQSFLEIHQPDPALPERLLGTCTHCQAWTLVDVGDDGQIRLTPLPHL